MRAQLTAARKFLLDAQNPDGGWPYQPGTQSSPEPTCLSLLALSEPGNADARRRAVGWLVSRLNGDGAVTLEGDDEPHWATALFVLALTRLEAEPGRRDVSAQWLLRWEAKRLETGTDVVLDGSLMGWPWTNGTFSWVEPTSQAVLALKSCGQAHHPRVAQAERMLLDRACRDGGWNYGNHTVLGVSLAGYPSTTAWATLALQNAADAAAAREKGLEFLEREIPKRPSALALSLGTLCVAAFGRPAGQFAQALAARQGLDGGWRGDVRVTALAVQALEAVESGNNVFKV